MRKRIWIFLVCILSMLMAIAGCGVKKQQEPSKMQEAGTADEASKGDAPEEGDVPEEGDTPEETAGLEEGDVPGETAGPEEADAPGEAAGPEEGDTPEETAGENRQESDTKEPETSLLPEDGCYTSKEEVALYIYQYGNLPVNFITKKEAEELGWKGGSLEPYAPGKCIGGSRFGNYEGLLPEKEGRSYTECDIDTLGAEKRGAKRIVFSNDGLIYYTEDHYESFELLYGEE